MRKLVTATDILPVFSRSKLLRSVIVRKFPQRKMDIDNKSKITIHHVRPNYFSTDFGKLSYMDDASNITKREETSHIENTSSNNCSKLEDLQSIMAILKEVLEYRTEKISSWIVERKVKTLCVLYKCLSDAHRKVFLQELAKGHAVNHKQVFQAAKTLLEIVEESDSKLMKTEEQLKNLLTPQYLWLFFHIGKLEKGVKFLVDLRTDVLDLIAEKNNENSPVHELQKLNNTLRELLSMWFSVGFLELERITWKSSCEMLQKISEYEAVHPVRNWPDLKRRVGSYRRCFIFNHRSMPGEPIVVLHTALRDEISSSVKDIFLTQSRTSDDQSDLKEHFQDPIENPEHIKAAVFYSISSTQKGLQGIELGNYLIKRVARELKTEFPQMTQFSSLSPIPLFRSWLLDRIKNAKNGHNDILTEKEMSSLQLHLKSSMIFDELRRVIYTNAWVEDERLGNLLEEPLMRLCARYLYLEKRRGYALDSVANFHLRNGAMMWRLNWKANHLPRGLSNSCGIMVNYRYYIEETETRSRAYLEKQNISASEQILKLTEKAQELIIFKSKSKI